MILFIQVLYKLSEVCTGFALLLVRKSDVLVEYMYPYPEVKYLINALLWGSVAAQEVATICRKTGTWVHRRLIL